MTRAVFNIRETLKFKIPCIGAPPSRSLEYGRRRAGAVVWRDQELSEPWLQGAEWFKHYAGNVRKDGVA